MNINTLEWDEELLNLFNIPKSILPEIRSSLGNFGKMRTSHSDVSIPITAVLGDQQAALFGHRCNTTGLIKCTYGTGGFVVKFMGSEIPRSNKGLLSTVAWTEKDNSVCYALEGSLFTSGSAVQWLKDGLKIIEDVNDSKVRAENVPDNGGVYFVPAFSGLGVPYWDASARGAFMGITGGTSQDHMIRAVLESMAYQVKEVIDTMDENNGTSTLALKVDGGACVNDFLMQFQADLLGIPIERPRDKDITVQGIAFAAGLASGFWQSLDELYNTPRIDIFRPNLNSTYAKDNFVIWKESVQRMRNWCLPKNNLL